MKNIDEYVEEKAKEFLKIAYAITRIEPSPMEHRINIKHIEEEFIKPFIKDYQPRVTKKWMGKFAHDVFVFNPSEKYTLYDFLKDKLKEIGVKVEEK